MRPKRLMAIGLVAVLCALLCAPLICSAHERRTVAGGKYDVVVGWDTEPAFVSQVNAASIRISKAGTNPAEPITGAEKTLKVEIRQGAQTKVFDLRAVFGQPGYYVADLLPTRPGDFQWTFSGAIGADQVTEKFDSADGKFDGVKAASGLEFPVAAPDPDQVTAQLDAARAAAQSAQTMGVLGVAFGALGLLTAIVVWLTRPRSRAVTLGSRRTV
jgi:hypothetical protein